MRVNIAIAIVLFSAAPALAQFTCQTTSGAHTFRAQDSAAAFASQRVIAQCQADPSTNNNDCASNVICDNGQYDPQICQTASSGQTFRASDSFGPFARANAIAACVAAPTTNNNDCNSQVLCASASGPQVTCQATSNGQIFRKSDLGAFARQEASAACQASPSTNNNECNSSVVCDNGPGSSQPGKCETTSNGQVFASHASDIAIARQTALAQCQASPTTNNNDCLSNMICASPSAQGNPSPSAPPSPAAGLCHVRQTNQWLSENQFYSYADQTAVHDHSCVVAKQTGVPSSGRIYRADGSRLGQGALSNSQVEGLLTSSGLANCERLNCDLQ